MPKQNQMDRDKLNRTEWPSTNLLAYTQRLEDVCRSNAVSTKGCELDLLHSEGFSELTGFLICCGVKSGQFEDAHDGIDYFHTLRRDYSKPTNAIEQASKQQAI